MYNILKRNISPLTGSSTYNDEIPHLFDQITSDKIAKIILNKYTYEDEKHKTDPDTPSDQNRSFKKRAKLGVKLLNSGSKIGLKHLEINEASETSNVNGPKSKRKAAHEILKDKIDKKKGVEECNFDEICVSFDFKKRKLI